MWPFRKKSESDILIDKIKNETLDMDGLFDSIRHRDELVPLVKELSAVCHPDRFPESKEKQDLATKLFKQVQTNRNNYPQLVQLKEIIEEQLSKE